MENNKSDFIKILKQAVVFVLSVVLIFIGFKLALFYMPFLIAFVFYLLVEPLIKFCMKKFNFNRKTSSLIILLIAILLIAVFLAWGIITVISEASNLLNHLNEYVNVIREFIVKKIESVDLKKLQIPDELLSLLNNSGQDIVSKGSELVRNFLTRTFK